MHVYIHHFDRIAQMGSEAHVNTCYKHFYYFVTEFSLIDPKELEPLVSAGWGMSPMSPAWVGSRPPPGLCCTLLWNASQRVLLVLGSHTRQGDRVSWPHLKALPMWRGPQCLVLTGPRSPIVGAHSRGLLGAFPGAKDPRFSSSPHQGGCHVVIPSHVAHSGVENRPWWGGPCL